MYTFLIILHVLVSILLTLAILMQSSKGGGLSGTFGGMGGSSLFGGREAATFLSKLTTGLAVAFFAISILIGIMTIPRGESTSIIKQEADRRVVPSANLPVPAGTFDEGSDNEKLPVGN
ncbi:MAG: preprotein translocase subunit SecG [Candidatus Marinimicrobia bacterium]|nr:preprotein translocase subunit SecG [Candidatus Neomarinimicrobiota bacterium]RKY61685.1 MAG: preprotein translocase subunit SecG [Candidatus Neomarinimicrobiota bacterium]